MGGTLGSGRSGDRKDQGQGQVGPPPGHNGHKNQREHCLGPENWLDDQQTSEFASCVAMGFFRDLWCTLTQLVGTELELAGTGFQLVGTEHLP